MLIPPIEENRHIYETLLDIAIAIIRDEAAREKTETHLSEAGKQKGA